MKNVRIFMKREILQNAINRAINMYFMYVSILIQCVCISLKLPDNNHVKV